VITGSACRDDAFSAGATPVADAPPAIARDIPAAPHTGRAFLVRLLFETCLPRAMVKNSRICQQIHLRQVSTFFIGLPNGQSRRFFVKFEQPRGRDEPRECRPRRARPFAIAAPRIMFGVAWQRFPA
jgi:hypothetical protein